MSKWLARALAITPSLDTRPKSPKSPKPLPDTSEKGGFGDFGDFGTGGPHRPEAPLTPALDIPHGWREALALPASDAVPKPAKPTKPPSTQPHKEVLGGFAGFATGGSHGSDASSAPAADGLLVAATTEGCCHDGNTFGQDTTERCVHHNHTFGQDRVPFHPPTPTPPLDGPAAWREALLALSPDRDPCPGFQSGAWARTWANALDFVEKHGDKAAALGWTTEELFGVHPVVGVVRFDGCGALMLSRAGRVVQVRSDEIRYANLLAFRRAPKPHPSSHKSNPSIPVWHFDAR